MSQTASSGSTLRVSNGTRQKKRMRVSEDAEELSCASSSEKFWFEDGNIILHVEETLFRVHRGVLSLHSSRFNEMFLVHLPGPGKSAQQNTIEGCRVADMKDDRTEDWDRVLGVIYGLDRNNKFNNDIVESMIRVGKKYGFNGIVDDAMQRIRDVVPTKLDDFHWSGQGLPVELFGDNTVPTFKLMRYLLEIGTQTTLPALFYVFTVYAKGTSAIFELCRLSGPSDLYQSMGERMAIGREQIIAASLELISTWTLKPLRTSPSTPIPEPVPHNTSPTCKHPNACEGAKQEYLRRYLLDPQPSFALKTGSEILDSFTRGTLCKVCRERITMTHDASRKVMWDRLPSFFGLPMWKDLDDSIHVVLCDQFQIAA